ncbi:hypothetical protein [Allokutzneria albata]|uniref:Uncharacterized protein n=1 Tax=Allokutzneria albata TaxID=211114 RepID=A0A1G9U0T9_ALLAB|nr:hypothetical protein [Allokutzneria albata]SDM53492.1 hypothetical protein SAMN04489726_2105 [Allokutzneria albata]
MTDQPAHVVPPSYATTQLSRALTRLVESGDERALKKVRQWEDVLAGIGSGRITVGSRAPVADTPVWVTLEVAHGGFATGRALSEVPLTDDEIAKLRQLPGDVPGGTDRERLNLWYLGDAGQAELVAALRAGHYRIDVAEDAALPVVALLLDKGFAEQALDLVAQLRPLMGRLRMTPRFEPVSRPSGAAVRVASVGEVAESLRAVTMPPQLTAMRETLGVWTPLYDRLVALWCRTVDGELPTVDDQVVRGGWPCARYPDDWADERARWIADFDDTARRHLLSGRHAHPKSNFARLHAALRSSEPLSARDVGWIRRAIANTVTRHGAPGSADREHVRAQQAAVVAAPTHVSLANVLLKRLDGVPVDSGVPSLDQLVAELPEGTPIPLHLQDKVARAWEAPVDELVRRGVITSGEVLAIVLPQLTSRLMASGIDDPVLAGLYEQTYTAFRRRRSLLLLNLEHQVRFEELPWTGALAPLRSASSDNAAFRSLQQVTMLALTEFPQTLLPNPLVGELGALANRAGVELPLVEEVAADIFMGTFTTKWRDAAAVASRTMAGTLYADYYDLPAAARWESPLRWGRRTADDFAKVCAERAKEAGEPTRSWVARNGAVLEQSQILTTHNLAVLVNGLGLAGQVGERAEELALRAFDWTVRRLAQRPATRHAALIQVKNAAHAWRQAIYLLSFCEPARRRTIAQRLEERVAAQGIPWFQPAVGGLIGVLDGKRFDAAGAVAGGRRFLGWATGKHWCLER